MSEGYSTSTSFDATHPSLVIVTSTLFVGMIRHIVATAILYLCFFMLTWPTIGIALTLEDELQELTEHYVQFKGSLQKKNDQLEEKIRRLEDQVRQKKQIQQDLESRMVRLASILQQQESRLSASNPRPLTKDFAKSVSDSDTPPTGVFHGMPTSCADLRQIGHVLNGFYSVLRNATVENVYCNFTEVPHCPGFQERIGYDNVTLPPIYFHVQRSTPFAEESTPISFNIVRINVGRAMNNGRSGKFTAPQAGIYSFIFNGVAKFPASSSPLRLELGLRLNNKLTAARVEKVTDVTVADDLTLLALQATLNLELGDEVWIDISFLSPGLSLYNDHTHLTCFSGWLLK